MSKFHKPTLTKMNSVINVKPAGINNFTNIIKPELKNTNYDTQDEIISMDTIYPNKETLEVITHPQTNNQSVNIRFYLKKNTK